MRESMLDLEKMKETDSILPVRRNSTWHASSFSRNLS
jgi:hypothetical protein